MAQNQVFRGVATNTRKEGVWTIGKYHNTDVVRWARRIDGVDEIILDSGGYVTATTALRMNKFANEHGLNFRVNRKDGDIIVTHTHPKDGGHTWNIGDGNGGAHFLARY